MTQEERETPAKNYCTPVKTSTKRWGRLGTVMIKEKDIHIGGVKYTVVRVTQQRIGVSFYSVHRKQGIKKTTVKTFDTKQEVYDKYPRLKKGYWLSGL